MFEGREYDDNTHVTNVSKTVLQKTTDSVQTGKQTGLGTKIIACLKKVASGGNLTSMGQILQFNMAVQQQQQQQYTLEEVRCHADSSSCWIAMADKVYDVTNFLIDHPGGKEIILENAGTDATIPFQSKGHTNDASDLLQKYLIGELIERDRRYKT